MCLDQYLLKRGEIIKLGSGPLNKASMGITGARSSRFGEMLQR
jgi:hypothetical protein